MLNKAIAKKMSGFLAVMLIVSMLVPVLAFANLGVQSGATYDKYNKTVTATVYTDVYDSVYGAVYLNVYGPDRTSLIGTVYKATYDSVVSGLYKYVFTATVSTDVYDSVYLAPVYNNVVGDVYGAVYNSGTAPVPCTTNCGGTGGDTGGGSIGGGTTGGGSSAVTVDANGNVNAAQLAALLKGDGTATLTISGDKAVIPASALANGKALTIVSGDASYALPIDKLDLAAIAKAVGVDLANLKLTVSIKALTGDDAKPVTAAAVNAGGTVVAGIVDFNLTATDKDGKQVPVDLSNVYVKRTLKLTKDAKNVTGVVYNSDTGIVSFVPSTFANGVATLQRPGNSIYTVIELGDKTFADVAGHWAQSDIELLANKLVVDGTSATTFEPERNISRAEFAKLVVAALGLTVDANAQASFSDVSSSAWYNGYVAAAAKAGLVNGFEDGTFRPDAQITREELAAMVVRALKFAGQDTSVSASEQATLLASYSDASSIVWGQTEVAAAVKAGIVNGMTDTTLGTNQSATRAQSAVMLKRLLTKAGFIN